MYIWQACFYWKESGNYRHLLILGRSWDQFSQLLLYLSSLNSPREKWLFYVHNLSFEFQFLAGVYEFKADDVFCMDKRKVVRANLGANIEFRCSYILTNLSLAKFTESMGVKHQKLKGERFDYSYIRTPSEALKRYQLNYCICDVLGLCEAIAEKLRRNNDSLYSIVLTATGYVRRDVKQTLRAIRYSKRKAWNTCGDIAEDLLLYGALKEAFRGGNTHTSRIFADSVSRNVASVDRSSSYPDVLVNRPFPKNRLSHIGELSYERVKDLITKHNMALLMRVGFKNLRLREDVDYISMPYMAVAKVSHCSKPVKDNGRILSTEKDSWTDCTITDLDLRLIADQYDFDEFICVDSWGSVYGLLPDCLRELIISYYKGKNEWKGVDPVLYQNSKEKLNSIYGMMVTDVLKESTVFEDGEYVEKELKTKEERLASFNAKGFVPYQWGVWCTAWARYELASGAKIIERYYKDDIDHLLYMDTDSLKFKIDSMEDLKMFDEYNKARIEASTKSGAFANDPKGNTHYMGVFEFEGMYDMFKSLGAKKYCVVKDGHLELTLSGVPKAKGARQLEKNGGLLAFSKGFIFTDCGVDLKYNDEVDMWVNIKGEKIHITRNIFMFPATYELNLEEDYERAIKIAKNLLTSGYDCNTLDLG